MEKKLTVSIIAIVMIMMAIGVASNVFENSVVGASNLGEGLLRRRISSKLRLINEKPGDRDKKVVSVIVTLKNGGSYD